MGHLDAALDLLDLLVALLQLSSLLTNRALVVVDELLGLGVLLVRHHAGVCNVALLGHTDRAGEAS